VRTIPVALVNGSNLDAENISLAGEAAQQRSGKECFARVSAGGADQQHAGALHAPIAVGHLRFPGNLEGDCFRFRYSAQGAYHALESLGDEALHERVEFDSFSVDFQLDGVLDWTF